MLQVNNNFMATFRIKTEAKMQQVYNIEAETKEEAEKIALENTQDFIEQTQISPGVVIDEEVTSEDK